VKHVSAGGPSTYPTDRKCVVIRKSDDVGVVGVHPASDQFQPQAPTRTMSSVLKCGHVRHGDQNCRWFLCRLSVTKNEYGYDADTGGHLGSAAAPKRVAVAKRSRRQRFPPTTRYRTPPRVYRTQSLQLC